MLCPECGSTLSRYDKSNNTGFCPMCPRVVLAPVSDRASVRGRLKPLGEIVATIERRRLARATTA